MAKPHSLNLFDLDIFYGFFFLKSLLMLLRLKKMLMMLFAFEYLTVNLIFVYIYLSCPFDPSPMLMFLAVAAGEASMGLSLLVSILRQSGKDNMLSSSSIQKEGFSGEIQNLKIGFGPMFGKMVSLSCSATNVKSPPSLCNDYSHFIFFIVNG